MTKLGGAVPYSVLAILTANARASQAARRLADDSVAAMGEAGLLRLL